ncbi:hypothetical protein PILCRDRAFT_815618 [Piloderma croceum F 1598]|uniref:Uncharacterized protein n=1 Tax=Piloderma croceum (strain F 1598) TaxID=765440 RepID=A0A0C3CBW6_PILCF|nr:hypothetical protein PILCRDRAFT_815618 [Piloderma croceum F 1598]
MVLQYILVAVAAGMFMRSRFGFLSKYLQVPCDCDVTITCCHVYARYNLTARPSLEVYYKHTCEIRRVPPYLED